MYFKLLISHDKPDIHFFVLSYMWNDRIMQWLASNSLQLMGENGNLFQATGFIYVLDKAIATIS